MRAFTVTHADIVRCPKRSLSPLHYREDGTCRCDEREAVMAEIEAAQQELNAARMRLKAAREKERGL